MHQLAAPSSPNLQVGGAGKAPSPEPPTSPLRLLLSPVLDLTRPQVAAHRLLRARRGDFGAVIVLGLLIYGVVLIGLVLWEGTLVEVWLPPQFSTAPSAPIGFAPSEVRSLTLWEVWTAWRADAIGGWLGPAELIVILVLTLGSLSLLLLAWFNLPLVHSTGPVWPAYRRALRASAALLWPLTWLTLLSGTLYVLCEHAVLRQPYSTAILAGSDLPVFLLSSCVTVGTVILVLWMCSALRAAAPQEPQLACSPRCEGCGYDLTHRPESGRCPECGLSLAASLDEATSRPGSLWSRTRSLEAWCRTSWEVLRRPTAFYRALKLRAPSGADAGFAEWHYKLLACGALLWAIGVIAVLSVRHGAPPPGIIAEILVMACGAVLLGVCGCWLGHRLVAGVVISCWLIRRSLPDTRWAVKVLTYETAYLWVFCLFWGLLLGSFALADNWISTGLGLSAWSGEAEVLALLLGTFILLVLWPVRYSIAYRAICWSNY